MKELTNEAKKIAARMAEEIQSQLSSESLDPKNQALGKETVKRLRTISSRPEGFFEAYRSRRKTDCGTASAAFKLWRRAIISDGSTYHLPAPATLSSLKQLKRRSAKYRDTLNVIALIYEALYGPTYRLAGQPVCLHVTDVDNFLGSASRLGMDREIRRCLSKGVCLGFLKPLVNLCNKIDLVNKSDKVAALVLMELFTVKLTIAELSYGAGSVEAIASSEARENPLRNKTLVSLVSARLTIMAIGIEGDPLMEIAHGVGTQYELDIFSALVHRLEGIWADLAPNEVTKANYIYKKTIVLG